MQTFNELKLSDALTKAIADLGYTKPSPIQAQTLPILLANPTDFIGLAATGTGKTAAFGIPILEKIDPKLRTVQAVILCPTRELSMQVAEQMNILGKNLRVTALPIYGGAGYADQLRGLKQGAQVIIGTPGRLIDHLERGTLKFDALKVVVLDEADEMISMGFREDMEKILNSAPRETSNVWLFSATMSPSVRKVADQYLRKPKMVQVNRSEMLSSTVAQSYYMTQESDKPAMVCKIIDAAEDFYGLVFCQTKLLVIDLNRYLTAHGYQTDCLHGDMSQKDRENTMAQFRTKKVKILICTDVAARGLDVKELTHVINYSIPRELDNYVHRIGRTARSGKAGLAISLVTPSHRYLLGQIEKMTRSRIVAGVPPSRKEIGAKKMGQAFTKLLAQKHFTRAIEIMDPNWKKLVSEMATEELAGRFLSMIYPEVFADSGRPVMERTARPEEEQQTEHRDRHPRSKHRSSGPGRRDYGNRNRRGRDERHHPKRSGPRR